MKDREEVRISLKDLDEAQRKTLKSRIDDIEYVCIAAGGLGLLAGWLLWDFIVNKCGIWLF